MTEELYTLRPFFARLPQWIRRLIGGPVLLSLIFWDLLDYIGWGIRDGVEEWVKDGQFLLKRHKLRIFYRKKP